ncbi:hypothetical protein PspLS_02376 [Pyricularia sp. CBS 133598]|nr:hypothetical protein PspLS_02376 [Pyricularia sp. CBS 133598]
MASTPADSEEFTIVKYHDFKHDPSKTLVDVARTSDGEILVGRRLEKRTTSTEFIELFNDTPAYDWLKQLLNHENLVSIAGEVTGARIVKTDGPVVVLPCQYLVFDHCDAGTLDTMLRKPPTPLTSTGFIPPSLCWHVLVSLLRALAWLHDGYREDGVGTTVNAPQGMNHDGYEQDNWFQDADWLAILHCNIAPENVFLQRPRGSETYGLVKLGNFANAQVANHVRGANGTLVAFRYFGDAPTSFIQLGQFRDGNFDKYPRDYAYFSRGSELRAVGGILYHMMTGLALPPPKKCPEWDCGCYHCAEGAAPCEHNCFQNVDLSSPDKCVEVFSKLTDYHGPYTDKDLCVQVASLIAIDPETDRIDSTVSTYQVVKAAHEAWLSSHPDGQLIVTLEDDLMARERRAWKKAERMLVLERARGQKPQSAISMPAQPYAPGVPPLLLTKRLSSFLQSNLSAHVHSALITTISGKLLSYASRQPVSTLRTQCTVAASIWAIQTAAAADPRGGQRRARGGDEDDRSDEDEEENGENGQSARKGESALVGALPPSASAESVASARAGRPRSITVQLSGAVVVIRPLKSPLLFICIGPSSGAVDPGTAAASEPPEEHVPAADGSGSPPQVTVSAAMGSPSETTSVLSAAPSTAATVTSVGASAAVLTRRHAEEMAKWLDDKLETLWVPEEGADAR